MLEHPVIASNPTLLAQHCIINWVITAKSHFKYHAQHLMLKSFQWRCFCLVAKITTISFHIREYAVQSNLQFWQHSIVLSYFRKNIAAHWMKVIKYVLSLLIMRKHIWGGVCLVKCKVVCFKTPSGVTSQVQERPPAMRVLPRPRLLSYKGQKHTFLLQGPNFLEGILPPTYYRNAKSPFFSHNPGRLSFEKGHSYFQSSCPTPTQNSLALMAPA